MATATRPAQHRSPDRTAPRSTWPATFCVVAGACSVLVVLALWVTGGGPTDLREPGAATTSLGRLTGLVAADLLLVQVALMARVPWFERRFGQDTLARWHRLVGFTSFHLMVVHIVLITYGYAASGGAGPLSEAWELITTYPGMLLATAGTVSLGMVVVTSVHAARRRLRYASWHLLHLYAYLGVGLALPHELWTGADFTSSPVARAYWWTLYAATAGAVVAFRLALPLWRTLRHRVVVTAVVPEGPGVVSVHLRGRHLDRMRVRAGQFFLWRFLDGPGWSRAHPYSLSEAPGPDRLRITVKDSGPDSRRMARLRPGTRVLLEGPYGRLTAPPPDGRAVTLLACGVGIAPLRSLLPELRVPVTLLYRARSPQDALFTGELAQAAASGRIRVRYLFGPRGRDGAWVPAGHQPGDLPRWVPGIATHHVYLCGPDAWMADAVRAVRTAGVPADRVHLERFSW